MAERRMFAKTIINSARFLKMPAETQALYFHLGLNADDDGIVEAYNVIRSTGVAEDNLKLLVAKEFIQVLNEDLVSHILNWNEHNKIRPDRKIDSVYKHLLIEINPSIKIIEKRPRADSKQARTTNGQPMDGIGKVRLGKISKEKNIKKEIFKKPTLDELEQYISEKSLNVVVETFLSYYEANGWQVGRNPMKDWKASLRYWNSSQTNKTTYQAKQPEVGSLNWLAQQQQNSQELINAEII